VPQRHHSLFTQVSTYTQKGLKKLREDFEENQEKLFGTGENSDFLYKSTFQIVKDDENQMTESSPSEKDKSDGLVQTLTENNQEIKTEERSLVRDDLSLQSSVQLSTNTYTPAKKLGQWAAGSQDITIDHEGQSVSHDKYINNEEEKGNGLVATLDSIETTPPKAIYMTSSAKQLYGSTKELKLKSDTKQNRKDSSLGRPPPIVFKEDWKMKEDRIRQKSAYGKHPNWRLLPILIKSNDDLRQEQLASQLIHCMANILARGKVPVWLYPYEIVALTFRGGIIEAIPDTISIDSLRKNYPDFTDLKNFFEQHFGQPGCDGYEDAKANFVESLAAYSMVCFLLQIKDRHNGNILLDNKGHLIHIDFGFFFLSSPGKNSGFESAPFKLTSEFVELMDGADSRTFIKFRELCYKAFLELRKNCFQITLLVQMLAEGNESFNCFRGRPHDAILGIQERFRLDLNDRACLEYVNSLINDSLENWTTTCYDRYQRCFVGVM
jgi:phosphatidylinositol 4-kinase